VRVQMLLTMAHENPSWGYTRLRGALENLGFDLGRSTIRRILTERGIEPAPLRGKTMPWKTFLKAHWGAIAAADFFSVEVLTRGGLVRYLVLFVIDLKHECLRHMVPLGERHLRAIVREFVEHYHAERNHQGLSNVIPFPSRGSASSVGRIGRRERLGGVLSFYERNAA
jgi:transposase InsO family protein